MAILALNEGTVIWLMLSARLAPTHHLPYIHTLFNYACTCLFGESLCGFSIGCQARSKRFVPERTS